MNPRYKKIYCCTPVAFAANEHFFIRDTGLISRTLQSMGIESKCIMPLPYHDSDQREGIIRTEYKNLRSVSWWKSLGIDAVILYSWGAPRYTLIARAIHKAGIKQVIHMDFSGNLSSKKEDNFIDKIKNIFVNLIRRIHLGYADIITTNGIAAKNFRKHFFYGNLIARKIYKMSTPVSPLFRLHEKAQKERKVVCVGRWSDDEIDAVKRPLYMIQTVKAIAERDDTVQIEIYGRFGAKVQTCFDSFPQDIKKRIYLKGYALNHELPSIYNSAQVAICTSLSEGTHIASAEALCCGCSLVIPPRDSLAVLHWYTSGESGTIAEEDTPEALAKGVLKELTMWSNKERNATKIAIFWQQYFCIDKAMEQIFQ